MGTYRSSKTEELESSWLKRGLHVGKTTAYVAASQVKGKVLDLINPSGKEKRQVERNKRNARRVTDTLGRLKGLPLKAGQILSTYEDIMPEESLEILAEMQNGVPPMDYAMIAGRVEQELGASPGEIFAEFEKDAFAAASLGQVHRAILPDGTRVAVKIQYPGIHKVLTSDVTSVNTLLKMTKLLGIQHIDQDGVADELREYAGRETDYENEACNITLYHDIFANNPDVEIPEVYPEYSTPRILTMRFIEGDKLTFSVKRSASQEVRNRIASILIDMFHRQLFSYGVLHADPHPGNYLLTPESRIGLLDFGCIKTFSPDMADFWREAFVAYFHNDTTSMARKLVHLGVITDEEEFTDWHEFLSFLSISEDVTKKINFAELGSQQRLSGRRASQQGYKMHPDVMLFGRSFLGLLAYIAGLDAEVNMHRAIRPYVLR